MKKILAMLLALVMIFSLAACGAKEEAAAPAETEAPAPAATEAATEAPTEAEPDPVDVTLWFIATNEVPQYIQDLPATVQKYYPWINVVCEHIPDNAITERVAVAYATDSCPDILYDTYSRISPAVSGGLAVDLTDVYEANKDVFISEPLDGVKDGKHYYLPVYADAPYCVQVNMTLAEELGVADLLPAEDEPWSYEEFLTLCRAVKAADPNIYPISLFGGSQSSDGWDFSMFLGNGARFLDDDNTTGIVNEPGNKEKIIEVLEFYQTLVEEKLIPDGAAAMTAGDCGAMFRAGQLLMCAGAYNGIPNLYHQMEEGTCIEMNAVGRLQPSPDGEYAVTASYGTGGLAVYNSNGNAEAAKLVVDAILKDQAWRQNVISTTGTAPVNVDVVAEYETPELTKMMAFSNEYFLKYGDSSWGILEPFWTDTRSVFFPLKQDLFTGNITPEEFVEKWDPLLDDAIANYNAG